MSDHLSRALRNLRHLYEQMLVPGAIVDTALAARGLLGPAIENIEKACRPEIHEIVHSVSISSESE